MKKISLLALTAIALMACGEEKAAPAKKAEKAETAAPVAAPAPAPVKEAAPAVSDAEFAALKAEGEKLYAGKCVACHQANGQGMQGAFPPLAKSDYLAENTVQRFAMQVHNGSKDGKGGLTVNGVTYSMPMPAQTQDTKEITALANYVLNSWGNSHGPVAESEVIAAVK